VLRLGASERLARDDLRLGQAWLRTPNHSGTPRTAPREEHIGVKPAPSRRPTMDRSRRFRGRRGGTTRRCSRACHDAALARSWLPSDTSDHVHLATATRLGRVVLTDDRRDLPLLHRARRDCLAEYLGAGAPRHTEILAIPQPRSRGRNRAHAWSMSASGRPRVRTHWSAGMRGGHPGATVPLVKRLALAGGDGQMDRVPAGPVTGRSPLPLPVQSRRARYRVTR
jgi:hypothetical protein